MSAMPDCLAWAYQGIYNATTSFWAHRMVLNFAQVKFSYMMGDIKQMQNQLELDSLNMLNHLHINDTISSSSDRDNDSYSAMVTRVLTRNANTNRDAFIQLFYKLLFQYSDGYNNRWVDGVFTSASIGYPAWWLEDVGYPDGPPPVEGSPGIDTGTGTGIETGTVNDITKR